MYCVWCKVRKTLMPFIDCTCCECQIAGVASSNAWFRFVSVPALHFRTSSWISKCQIFIQGLSVDLKCRNISIQNLSMIFEVPENYFAQHHVAEQEISSLAYPILLELYYVAGISLWYFHTLLPLFHKLFYTYRAHASYTSTVWQAELYAFDLYILFPLCLNACDIAILYLPLSFIANSELATSSLACSYLISHFDIVSSGLW